MTQSIEEKLASAEAFIAEAQVKVQQGQAADLTGLDALIASACEDMVALPDEAALAHQERLKQLMEKLAALGQALQAQYEATKGELESIGTRQQAVKAYGTAMAAPKKPDGGSEG